MLWWYAAALDGLDDGFPFVGAEPGSCYAGIGYVEDGDGEGLELGGWGDGEVDHLVVALVECHMLGMVCTYPSICEVDNTRLALL